MTKRLLGLIDKTVPQQIEAAECLDEMLGLLRTNPELEQRLKRTIHLLANYSEFHMDQVKGELGYAEQDHQNGKKGGRGNLPGAPSFNTRDADVVREFKAARLITQNDTEAAKRMINGGFVDLHGKKLSPERIRGIVRKSELSEQKNNTPKNK